MVQLSHFFSFKTFPMWAYYVALVGCINTFMIYTKQFVSPAEYVAAWAIAFLLGYPSLWAKTIKKEKRTMFGNKVTKQSRSIFKSTLFVAANIFYWVLVANHLFYTLLGSNQW